MNSIRRTLLVWLLAGLAVIAFAASGATYLAARREVGDLLDLQLKQLAYSTRIDDLLRGRRPGFDARSPPIAAGITELVTQIWDRDGVLVYWSQPGTGLPVPATEGYSTVNRQGRNWRVYTLVQGTHALQVAQAQDEREAIATQTAMRTLIPFLALLPIFGALIWLGVGRGLEPLEAMSRAVAKRRPDAMAPLGERGLPEELQPLVASLNGLLARLSDALAAQRRFTADAAHELRTPLAALKLQLDLARRNGACGEWRRLRSTMSKRAWRAPRTSSSNCSHSRASSPSRSRSSEPIAIWSPLRATRSSRVPHSRPTSRSTSASHARRRQR